MCAMFNGWFSRLMKKKKEIVKQSTTFHNLAESLVVTQDIDSNSF
jgi:hypothetical protein